MAKAKRIDMAAILEEPGDKPKRRASESSRNTQRTKSHAPQARVVKQQHSRRPNVKQHTAYLPLPVHEQLRRIAFDEDTKIHDLLMEGVDHVFAKRGMKAIQELLS